MNDDKTYLQALSALIDNELSQNERANVLKEMADDPQAAERVAHYRSQNAALKALFPLTQENVRCIVLPRRTPWKKRAGISAVWLTLGIFLGLAPAWLVPYLSNSQPMFAKNADTAYSVYAPEQRHPVEVAANNEKHLIAWLSKRLDRPLTVPSLREYGYSLIGGRLLPGESGPAAQFMYQDKAGKRLTLYITAAAKKNAANIRTLRDNKGQGTFYWVNQGMGYALSGRASEPHLRSMAYDVCQALGDRKSVV